jgi:hypothetical protein
MCRAAIIAVLVLAAASSGNAAQTEPRDALRPKCTFHILSDIMDMWSLASGPSNRKWLVMNVGEKPVVLMGSENTSRRHRRHEELIGAGASAIATMQYGQPTIRLVAAGDRTTVVVCRYFVSVR